MLKYILLLFIMLLSATASAAVSQTVHKEIGNKMQLIFNERNSKIPYIVRKVDLNGDGVPEIIVYPMTDVCGGGNPVLVFSQKHQYLRLIGRINTTFPPVVVADTKTHGWRDIIITMRRHGATQPYDIADKRFQSYRARACASQQGYLNPIPKKLNQPVKGKVIITFKDFDKAFKKAYPDYN